MNHSVVVKVSGLSREFYLTFCGAQLKKKKKTSPLLPTPGAPITAILTSHSPDFFRLIPRMALLLIAYSFPILQLLCKKNVSELAAVNYDVSGVLKQQSASCLYELVK